MPRTNKDVEDFHNSARPLFEEVTVNELFDECGGDSSNGKSVIYKDKGTNWKEWLFVPKTMLLSGDIKVRKLSNGFEVIMPEWFAKKNGLA
jgi:hypothetical protein